MTVTQWRETAAEVKDRAIDTVKGDLTLTKLDFCLIGAICFLAGICIGLLAAPLTHGVGIEIGSNNGSHNTGNGCHNGSENGNNESHNC